MNPTRVEAIREALGIIVQPALRPVPRIAARIAAGYNAPADPMSLLTAHDLVKRYGAHDVFQNVSLAVAHQSRTALVGPNGVGKSSLLALLAGVERPDGGRIHRARKLRIGFLPQDGRLPNASRLASTVWEVCLEAFADVRRQESVLARLEAKMADPARAEEALASYGPLQEAFERQGGYAYAARIRQVLRGLGLPADRWDRSPGDLSGGERTRLSLARLLLDDPGLLLLDEPTNHLDLEAVEWLESWLREWPGAVVVVSHDRFFLDRLVTAVWELTPEGLEVYAGDYSAYARQRAERRLTTERRYRAQQDHIRKEQEYIRRNIAGQNTRQAKGRRKRLEHLEVLTRPADAARTPIRLAAGGRSGELVLETRGLVVSHPGSGAALFAVPDLSLRRGECVAILGPNGAGKTSLLRTLLGQSKPLAGDVRLGPSVRPGYLSQTEDELAPDESVLESLRSVGDLPETDARSWLARFGLAENAEQTVASLSGGERRRLALARLARRGANLLLLDEPTNNLDLPAQEALQHSLASFPETILLVTHDRYLARALATQVWSLATGDEALEVYRGPFDEYLAAKAARRVPAPATKADRATRPRRSPRDRETAALEAAIDRKEKDLAALAAELDAARGDVRRVTSLGVAYARMERELHALLEAWERAAGADEPA